MEGRLDAGRRRAALAGQRGRAPPEPHGVRALHQGDARPGRRRARRCCRRTSRWTASTTSRLCCVRRRLISSSTFRPRARSAGRRSAVRPRSRARTSTASTLRRSELARGRPAARHARRLLREFYFPTDGDYEFNIRDFLWMGAGYVTKVDSAPRRHPDDRRRAGVPGGPPAARRICKAVDQRQAEAADEMQARFNHIRVKVKAGQRRVGVAFIQRSFAESDSTLRPIAALPEMERTPRIPGLDISGPFNVTGLGDTESRRRIFVCTPGVASGRDALRASHLREPRAAGLPPPRDGRRPEGADVLLRDGPRAGRASKRASRAGSQPSCRAPSSCSAPSR